MMIFLFGSGYTRPDGPVARGDGVVPVVIDVTALAVAVAR